MTNTHAIPAPEVVALNRRAFRDARVLAIEVFGGAGVGKTTLLESTLRRLEGRYRIGVVVANPTADRDSRRLRTCSRDVVIPVPATTIDAKGLHDVLADVHLRELDVLFVESIVGLSAVGRSDLGQDLRVGVFSVTGGDDKAAEFPAGVTDADLVLLNKLDLLPHVHFDTRVFRSDVRRRNLDVPVLHVSAAVGTGMDEWVGWISDQLFRVSRGRALPWCEPPDLFLG